eukprot:m.123446 g.123446  ORF g.123446 m.123446 type:complete len:1930 (-) comp9410_c1_seq1:2129-7918(-)
MPLKVPPSTGNLAVVILLIGCVAWSKQQQQQQCDGSSLGICNDANASEFRFISISSLPSGGFTEEEKSGGKVPSNAKFATVLFEKLDPALSTSTVFVCKTLLQSTFSLCPCNVPLEINQGCFQMNVTQPLGQVGVVVQLVAILSSGKIDWTNRLDTASFSWIVDLIPPVVSIGQHYGPSGESVLGAGPSPCYSSQSMEGSARFELTSNEDNVNFRCRLLDYNTDIKGYEGAPDDWSIETTALWLQSLLHAQEQLSLSSQSLNATTIVEYVRQNVSVADLLQREDQGIANLLRDMKQPFTSCGVDPSSNVRTVLFSNILLENGLKKFQALGVDAAGNAGVPTEYKFYVDAKDPTVVFYDSNPRIPSTSVNIGFYVNESISAAFMDHLGKYHDCNSYKFQIKLQDVTIKNYASQGYLSEDSFEDDVNDPNITKYDYRRLSQFELRKVNPYTTRTMLLKVAARDIAGNEGRESSNTIAIDRRGPKPFIVTPMSLISQRYELPFMWRSDEEGPLRDIEYKCTVRSSKTTVFPCTYTSLLTHLLKYPNEDGFSISVTGIDETASLAANPFSSSIDLAWTVDDVLPAVELLSEAPASFTNETSFNFTFKVTKPAALHISLLYSSPSIDTTTVAASTASSYQLVYSSSITSEGNELRTMGSLTLPQKQLEIRDGSYSMNVSAIDHAGNLGATLLIQWTVDTQAPLAKIVPLSSRSSGLPWLNENQRSGSIDAVFSLISLSDPFANFLCSINCQPIACMTSSSLESTTCLSNAANSSTSAFCDGVSLSEFSPCQPTTLVTLLVEGHHVFEVAAVDAAGNVGNVVSISWDVDITSPIAVLDRAPGLIPPLRTKGPDVTFYVDVDESLAFLECTLVTHNSVVEFDENILAEDSLQSCTSPITFFSLSSGTYTFQVRAVDDVGNVQSAYNEKANGAVDRVDAFDWYTFTIDNDSPTIFVVSVNDVKKLMIEAQEVVTNHPRYQVNLEFSEPLMSLECEHCYVQDGEEVCRNSVVCSLDGIVVAVTIEDPFNDNVAFQASSPFDIVPCRESVERGCVDAAVPQDSAPLCTFGAFDACDIAPLSFDLTCLALSDIQEIDACVKRSTYYHRLVVTATDYAGNIQTSNISQWVFDIYRPRVELQVVGNSQMVGTSQNGSNSDVTSAFTDETTGQFITTLDDIQFVVTETDVLVSVNVSDVGFKPETVEVICSLHTPTTTISLRGCESGSTILQITRSLLQTGGLYVLHVSSQDRAGNVGHLSTLSWIIVEDTPSVLVNEKSSTIWTNSSSAHVSFSCNQFVCFVFGRISAAKIVTQMNNVIQLEKELWDGDGTWTVPVLYDPLPSMIHVYVEAPSYKRSSKAGVLAFILNNKLNLEEVLNPLLDGASLKVNETCSREVLEASSGVGNNDDHIRVIVCMSVSSMTLNERDTWRMEFSRLVGQRFFLVGGYEGVSTREVAQDGVACTCADCATQATCAGGVACDCIAFYSGSDAMRVAVVNIPELRQTDVSLPVINWKDISLPSNETFHHFQFDVDFAAVSAVSKFILANTSTVFSQQQHGSGFTTWKINQDMIASLFGFSKVSVVEISASLVHVEYELTSLDHTLGHGFGTFQCSLAQLCGLQEDGYGLCHSIVLLDWGSCNGTLITTSSFATFRGTLILPVNIHDAFRTPSFQLRVRAEDAAGNQGPSPYLGWNLIQDGFGEFEPDNRRVVAVDVVDVVDDGYGKGLVFFNSLFVDANLTCVYSLDGGQSSETLKSCVSPIVFDMNDLRSGNVTLYLQAISRVDNTRIGGKCFAFAAKSDANTFSSDLCQAIFVEDAIVSIPASSTTCNTYSQAALKMLTIFLLCVSILILGIATALLIRKRLFLPSTYRRKRKVRTKKAFHNPAFQADAATRSASRASSSHGSLASEVSFGQMRAPSVLSTRSTQSQLPKILPKRKRTLTPIE